MKKYYFVVSNCKRNKPASMLEVSSNIVEKMNGNKYLPDAPYSTPEMQDRSARLQTAYNNRGNGKPAKMELGIPSSDMEETLRSLSYYVTSAAAIWLCSNIRIPIIERQHQQCSGAGYAYRCKAAMAM